MGIDSTIARGTIHPTPKGRGISLPLDPTVFKKELIGVINRKVAFEVLHVLKELKDKDFASLSFSFIHSTFEIVPEEQYFEEMAQLRGTIKEKDLEHLATARALGIYIIAYDRDFEGMKEYFTPKEFLESMKLKTTDTIY